MDATTALVGLFLEEQLVFVTPEATPPVPPEETLTPSERDCLGTPAWHVKAVEITQLSEQDLTRLLDDSWYRPPGNADGDIDSPNIEAHIHTKKFRSLIFRGQLGFLQHRIYARFRKNGPVTDFYPSARLVPRVPGSKVVEVTLNKARVLTVPDSLLPSAFHQRTFTIFAVKASVSETEYEYLSFHSRRADALPAAKGAGWYGSNAEVVPIQVNKGEGKRPRKRA